MLEKELTIPIPGTNLNIYSKLYGNLDSPVVIFVHGLTGYMDEHLFYNGARYFYEHGISSLRFNLYDWQEDARNLIDCTLATHAEDINTVIEYLLKEGVKKLYAIGHSYGGPSILLANHEKLQAMVLWDPSSGDFKEELKNAVYIPKVNSYYIRWGVDVLVGAPMIEEAEKLDWGNLTANIATPMKIIAAEKGELLNGGKIYFEKAKGPKELTIIQSADHGFTKEGTLEQLFQESVAWIKKYV